MEEQAPTAFVIVKERPSGVATACAIFEAEFVVITHGGESQRRGRIEIPTYEGGEEALKEVLASAVRHAFPEPTGDQQDA